MTCPSDAANLAAAPLPLTPQAFTLTFVDDGLVYDGRPDRPLTFRVSGGVYRLSPPQVVFLIDVAATLHLCQGPHDFLTICDHEPADGTAGCGSGDGCGVGDGGVWVADVACRGGTALVRFGQPPAALGVRLTDLFDEYDGRAVLGDGDLGAYARRAFDLLTDPGGLGLLDPTDASDTGPHQGGSGPTLTVRVGTRHRWPLLMPFDHFRRFPGYGRFSAYAAVEWIITKKTLVQNALERLALQREMQDVAGVLEHSIFVINRYPHFDADPAVARATSAACDLLADAFGLLQDVQIGIDGRRLSARAYVDPPAGRVLATLRDRETWYFFADFHVVAGEWQAGGRADDRPNPVPLDSFARGELSHVRLAHVFHCRSSDDPFGSGRRRTICAGLLDAGVRRVGGSPAEERFMDYACFLLRLLCGAAGLGPVLIAQALAKDFPLEELIMDVNELLRSQGLPELG
jgi:hypothetical protein